MKLLFCRLCCDVFNLVQEEMRYCQCGFSGVKYIDNFNAVYRGLYAVPLGIDNASFVEAIKHQPEHKPGKRFTTFVIEKDCPTFTREDNEKTIC